MNDPNIHAFFEITDRTELDYVKKKKLYHERRPHTAEYTPCLRLPV